MFAPGQTSAELPKPPVFETAACPLMAAVAPKLSAHCFFFRAATKSPKRTYGLFIVNGILSNFNHESPRRGETVFRDPENHAPALTRASSWACSPSPIPGAIWIRRARTGVNAAIFSWKAMWLMLQQPVPDDFRGATAETNSVRPIFDAAGGRCWPWIGESHVETDWAPR